MTNTPSSLSDAIAAARAGRRDDAARMLRTVVDREPFNADAWVWLAGVTSDFREQRSALERAVAIDPSNQRAQQGLSWLRHSHPEVFDAPDSSATRPLRERTTPSYEQPTIASSTIDDDSAARVYDAPTTAASTPTAYDQYSAATQPMPTYDQPRSTATPEPFVIPDDSTARMPAYTPNAPSGYSQNTPPSYTPAAATSTYAPVPPPPAYTPSSTDRMQTVPPPATAEKVRYDNRGNASRWLLLLIWLFGFGASATLAALIILYPDSFEGFARSIIDPLLRPIGFQLSFGGQQAIAALIGTLSLIAIAVFDFIIILGMLFRGRWAWVLNLLIALLVVAGTVALFVLAFMFNTPSTFDLLPLVGLAVFVLIYFILSLTSRRAFFRRRVV